MADRHCQGGMPLVSGLPRSIHRPSSTPRSSWARAEMRATSSSIGSRIGWSGHRLRFDLTVPLARFIAQHVGVGHPVQALPRRPGLAGREPAARAISRVHAVRLRHDRHREHLRRRRDHSGDPRPLRGVRFREVHGSDQQPQGPQRHARNARDRRSQRRGAARYRQAAQDRSRRRGRRTRRVGRHRPG